MSDQQYQATTRTLTRIIIILEEIKKPVTIYKIKKALNDNGPRVKDALLWLVNHKLIKRINTGRKVLYMKGGINENFKNRSDYTRE